MHYFDTHEASNNPQVCKIRKHNMLKLRIILADVQNV